MSHCGVAYFFGILAHSNYSPRQCVSVIGLIDATGLKNVAKELFNYGYRCYFSRLDSIGSICIKAVA